MNNAAQFQTTIDESSFDGIAPVYTKYDSEFQPKPAFIRMDEDGEIDAWVNGDNGTPMRVWHGRTLTWRVPSNVRGDALLAFVQGRQPLFERVYLGHEVDWDGNNHVGKLNEDAQEASEEIEKAAESLCDETIDVCSMEEWMRAEGNNKLRDLWVADQSLEAAAEEAEASARDAMRDGVWVTDPESAKEDLLEWAHNEFRDHPERLGKTHFEALIAEGTITREDAQEVIDEEDLDIQLSA